MRSFAVVMSIVCLTTGTTQAVAEDYWPLEVGNWWLYQHRTSFYDDNGDVVDGIEEVLLEVLSQEEINGTVYFRLSNGQLLRKNEEGSIVERRKETDVVIFDLSHMDDPKYQFSVPRDSFPLTGGGGSGYPSSRSNVRGCSVVVPAGTFSCISFSDGQFEELYAIFFAEGVGPAVIQRYTDLPEYMNRYELIRYSVGGESYPTNIKQFSWAGIKKHHLTKTHRRREDEASLQGLGIP